MGGGRPGAIHFLFMMRKVISTVYYVVICSNMVADFGVRKADFGLRKADFGLRKASREFFNFFFT